jgi:hypothetical protein
MSIRLSPEQVHALRCVERGELDTAEGHDLLHLDVLGLIVAEHPDHGISWTITQAGRDWLEQEK